MPSPGAAFQQARSTTTDDTSQVDQVIVFECESRLPE